MAVKQVGQQGAMLWCGVSGELLQCQELVVGTRGMFRTSLGCEASMGHRAGVVVAELPDEPQMCGSGWRPLRKPPGGPVHGRAGKGKQERAFFHGWLWWGGYVCMECRVGWKPSQGLGAVAGKCGICPWCWGSTGWFGEIKRVGLHGREELVVGTRAMSSTFLGCEASMFFICSAGKCGVCLE